MPTYDYKCQKCGHQFEFFQSMSSDRLTDCPEESCGGDVKRLLGTGAGIIFKGTGFYETDYKRGESYKAAAKADSKEPAASSNTDSGKKSADTSKPKTSSTGSKAKASKPSD